MTTPPRRRWKRGQRIGRNGKLAGMDRQVPTRVQVVGPKPRTIVLIDRVDEQERSLSGMHWTCSGATATLSLRCQQASGRWEEIWQQPHNQTGTA
jgi:hypothetical protein